MGSGVSCHRVADALGSQTHDHQPVVRGGRLSGDEPDEVIVAKAGSPFLHFTWHGKTGRLTAMSDLYGNRLTIRADEQGRPCWIENEGGLALRIVYQRHI